MCRRKGISVVNSHSDRKRRVDCQRRKDCRTTNGQRAKNDLPGDVRVKITMFDDPEWPFSDTIYVMTSATPEEVASWFDEDLRPDDVWEGFVDVQAH
jgi:hypothetical protein